MATSYKYGETLEGFLVKYDPTNRFPTALAYNPDPKLRIKDRSAVCKVLASIAREISEEEFNRLLNAESKYPKIKGDLLKPK